MALTSIVIDLKSAFRRFARCERGNIAAIFAASLPVLLSGVGVAIDYSRAANARSAMQSAADAAALMVSKEASSLNASQLTTKAQNYFNAIYNHPEVGGVTFSANYTANSGNGASVIINASGSMPTDFMKLVGFTSVPINVSSTTKWGNLRYRVALALDNTGSMDDDDKMNQLKLATKQLINDFYSMASSNDDVYVSIIPFSKDVNVGTSNKNASWLRWTDWDETNGSCSSSWYNNKTSCVNNGKTWTASSHNNWNGCVMDRDQSYDIQGTGIANSPTEAMAPAEQYSYCPVSILGMTSVRQKKQDLIDKVNAMTPVGSTNQGIGTFWAWMSLLSSGPFTGPAKDANYTYMDVIILLTDGLNTQNRYAGNGYSHSTAVDGRQALLCSAIKTAGVKVFAVQVATNGDPVSDVTKNCTTEPNNPNYFSYITQASQMTVKFQNIVKELAKLRVAA